VAAATALALGACTAAPEPADPSAAEDEPASERAQRREAPLVHGEVGALDVDAVKQTVWDAMPAFERCVEGTRRRLPFVGGEVELFIRVDQEGAVRATFLRESTLGDHQAESCILDVVRDRDWPRPEGGDEGEITQRFSLEPGTGVRPPTPLGAEQLGMGLRILRPRLRACRHRARTGPLDLTLYVDPKGKAMSVGVAVADEKGLDAIDCVVRTMRAGRFATPGSYPAKVTVPVR